MRIWKSKGPVRLPDPLNISHPLHRGLVGRWLYLPGLAGATTWRDLSQHGNHGTLTGVPSGYGFLPSMRTGGWGKVQLDGAAAYVSVGNRSTVAITGKLTVACWFKSTALNVINRPTLVCKGYDGTNTGYTLGFNEMGSGPSEGLGRLCFLAYNSATGVSGSYTTADFASDTNWHRAVGTWDGTQWNTYIDGKLDRNSTGTQTVGPQVSSAALDFGIEMVSGAAQRFYAGSLDDVCILNRVWTPAEIQWDYLEALRGYPETIRRGRSPIYFTGGGTTVVTKTTSLVWNTQAAVVSQKQVQWNARIAASQSRSFLWNTRTTVSPSRQLSWNVRAAVSSSRSLLWNTRSLVGPSKSLVWNVRVPAGLSRSLVWNMRGLAALSRLLVWNTASNSGVSTLTIARALAWNTRSTADMSRALAWKLRATASLLRSLPWAVRGSVRLDRFLLWQVGSVGLAIQVDQRLFWQTRNQASLNRSLRWNTVGPLGQQEAMTARITILPAMMGKVQGGVDL